MKKVLNVNKDNIVKKSENDSNILSNAIEALIPYENSINYIAPIIAKNGLSVDDNALYEEGHSEYAAVIPGIAICNNSAASCHIINTMNEGFRFMGVPDDISYTIDLGPVVTPCIIGDTNRPLGVYIPLAEAAENDCLEEVISIGKEFLINYINNNKD